MNLELISKKACHLDKQNNYQKLSQKVSVKQM